MKESQLWVTVVARSLPEPVKATPSTSHEQMENLVVLAEDEMQTSVLKMV